MMKLDFNEEIEGQAAPEENTEGPRRKQWQTPTVKQRVFSQFRTSSGWCLSLVQFICIDVNTVFTVECRPNQLYRERLEEVLSVQFQMNSGVVRLW